MEEWVCAAQPLIELAIAEDIGPGDATSQATLDPAVHLCGRIVAKAAGVIAGLPLAEAVLKRVDPTIAFTALVGEGQEVVPGELVAEVVGPGPSLLAAERILLNFLQRLSGVATLTRRYVDAVATTRARILDTRKTIPGYRALDKYAVRMGGGHNHRLSLYDMLMVKDNHVDGAGGLVEAVTRARVAHPELPIEVEVRDLDELRQALSVEPALDRILLDNMSLETMRQAILMAAGRVPLEASGGVTLESVADIAATGVDMISAGALTHSAPALDLSMKVVGTQDLKSLDEQRPVRDPAAVVAEIKASLGERLVILGHHYQRDEVIAWADYRGDSLKLARDAAQTEAEFIVFCGVHFMAEVAAILARPGQHVLIPDPTAGCYLADTATSAAVQAAWQALDLALGQAEAEMTPITYVNSSAELKAFCGRHGGLVCTSSNAEQVLRLALAQRRRVFFFPDQHLGRNTARRMGISAGEMLLWDLRRPPTADQIRQAKVVLWPGACNVHQRFWPEHVHAVRSRYPGIRVSVHPECDSAVVELADEVGSTAYIIRQIEAAPAGTQWAVGTESRLVHRLAREHPEQRVVPLADVPPYCPTMGQITLPGLAETLQALAQGVGSRDARSCVSTSVSANEVAVEPETARWARVALERMLAL